MQGSTVTADYGGAAEKLNRTVSWMLQDGQPSTRQLLNSSQTVVASYTSDAFGNSVASSGSSANPLIWNGGSGYYSDAESGLQKVGARYYDPAVGRWISQDALLVAGSAGDSQAVNRYCYCGESPVAGTDGSGRLSLPEWFNGLSNMSKFGLGGGAIGLVGAGLAGLYVAISSFWSNLNASENMGYELGKHPMNGSPVDVYISRMIGQNAVDTAGNAATVTIKQLYGSPGTGMIPH